MPCSTHRYTHPIMKTCMQPCYRRSRGVRTCCHTGALHASRLAESVNISCRYFIHHQPVPVFFYCFFEQAVIEMLMNAVKFSCIFLSLILSTDFRQVDFKPLTHSLFWKKYPLDRLIICDSTHSNHVFGGCLEFPITIS